jgi:aminopeptidase-like protein
MDLPFPSGERLPEGARAGQEMHELIARLYPICRSITGDGVRETLKILREYIPLEVREVPSGTRVFDWTVPKEWNIRGAYVRKVGGETVVDFKDSNLHVVSYSVPVSARLPLAELKRRLHTLPEHPDWIPYRTSYYNEDWGFCLSHKQLESLEEGEYEVSIDSTLRDGHLTYGECFLKGETEDEVLIYAHVCHPSLANDNLSGIAVAVFWAAALAKLSLRLSYRFVFAPGAIGAITWLSVNEARVSRIKHGLVLACLGDTGAFTYKKSRRGNADIDRAAAQALRDASRPHRIVDFSPYGYDERQFCSPGFNLPVGCLMRTPHGEFPEYHTSADNLELVKARSLGESLRTCISISRILERNRKFVNQNPRCEPQLGRRGLYDSIGGADKKAKDLAMLWLLNYSDGDHDLLGIAEKSGLAFDLLAEAAERLASHGLLKEQGGTQPLGAME